MKTDFDLLIVGGGMVGASMVHALRGSGLCIGLVEAVALHDPEQPSYDSRAIALSWGSRRIFEGMGMWRAMERETVTPIERIRVSDRGHFGAVRISAEEEGVEALGYVAEAAVIGRALASDIAELDDVELFCPASVESVAVEADSARIVIQFNGESREVTARLLVAADGGRSTVREQLGARTFDLGYNQTAVIANAVTDRAHGNIAFERFTNSGPLALLPNTAPEWMEGADVGECRWSVVWTVHNHEVDEHLALDDDTFIERLQARFGQRAGKILSVTPRAAYPLKLQFVRDHVRHRLVFIGNAAHLIHPVGGQGLNLGLRDVAVLAEVLVQAARDGRDPGTLETLDDYARWRRADYIRVAGFTDSLTRLFSTDFRPLVVARNLGMISMDLLPPLRRLFTRQAMGVNGRQPRLALGLPFNEEQQ